MSGKLSRRDFIKLVGVGAAASAVITGCGPASRYVIREPYTDMPEYSYNGKSTFFATTCFECAAGCGLVVRTVQGRAIKVEGNKNNPVNLGKTCARGQTTLQGLYNPDRVQNPTKQARKEILNNETVNWEDAIDLIADSLSSNQPDEIAFLLGNAPDQIFDLVSSLTESLGAPSPIRYSALGMFEAQSTLKKASKNIFAKDSIPNFDLGKADAIFSFGANFLETWLSPVSYTRGFSQMRKGENGKRGYFVQFESRMSQTAAVADEWVPIKPGTESFVAQGLGRAIAEEQGSLPTAYRDVDLEEINGITGISEEDFRRLAKLFANSDRPIAIPGGAALGQINGLEIAEEVLTLNVLAGNIGQVGGINLNPSITAIEEDRPTASLKEIESFIEKLSSGKVKALFVHGVNPIFEIPEVLGYAKALDAVPLVISFSSFPDETAIASDYIFPDHTGLESWGYQSIQLGTKQATISGAQPAVSPFYNTRSTSDVILAATKLVGGNLAGAIPFEDEVAFIKSRLLPLVSENDGFYGGPEINTFFSRFQQFGGWWKMSEEDQSLAANGILEKSKTLTQPSFVGEGDYHFLPYMSPILAESGANKPSLQETPDPISTVMWNTWVELNPETAKELDIHEDDVIRVVSDTGAVEAAVYINPGLRPDTIAMPFGQGHTAYGRYAQGRGANPADLFELVFNDAGDLAFAANKVSIEKTDKHHSLARMASPLTDKGIEIH